MDFTDIWLQKCYFDKQHYQILYGIQTLSSVIYRYFLREVMEMSNLIY